MKKTSKRILSLALSFILLLSLCPNAAFATDAAEGQGSVQNVSRTASGNSGGGSEESKFQKEKNSNLLSSQGTDDGSASEDQIDPQSMDDTLPKSPIQSILGKEADGAEKIYTTLLDSENRIIDTTDPDLEKDAYYQSKEEGGQAGTVDLDAQLKVRFRMAEIIENDGENGIQEKVCYYMTLPQELVPLKKDSSGRILVDPESPLSFFQSSDLQCLGGIYTEGTSYQLQLQFVNVADQLNISGTFQYDVNLASTVEAGKKCTVSFVPGGNLEFNVTPKKEEPIEADESLSISGVQNTEQSDKIDWTLTLTDKDMKLAAKRLKVSLDGSAILTDYSKSDAESNLAFTSLVITYKDGTEETLSAYRMNNSAFSFYRNGKDFNPTMTDDGTKGILGTVYTDGSDYKEENTILVSGNGKFLTNTLYIDMAALRSNASSQGNNSGIDKPSDIDLEISKYEFHFSSQIYDNYDKQGSNSYTANVSMTDADEKNPVSASAAVGINLGELDNGRLEDTVSKETNYLGLPSAIETEYTANQSTYRGNYYFLQFAPQQSYNGKLSYNNSGNAIFYSSLSGFFEGRNQLVGSSNSAFEALDIGGATGWNFCSPVDASDLKDNSSGKLLYFVGSDENGLFVIYQMQKVFSDLGTDEELLLYKSSSKVDGRYIYLLVDPQTRAEAKYSIANGWSRLAKSSEDGTDAKAADWKIHVFNAAGQSLSLNFIQKNGSAYAKDEGTEGSATDTMLVSNRIYGASGGQERAASAGYRIISPEAAQMTGSWVKDDTIFWEFTVNTENLPSCYSSKIYIRVPEGQELCIGNEDEDVSINGTEVNIGLLSYYKNDAWNALTGSADTYSGSTASPLTIDSVSPSISKVKDSDNLYQISYGGTVPSDSEGQVRIGFATKLTDSGAKDSASKLSCQAELVTATGESAWGTNGMSRYPFKISAEGNLGRANISKEHVASGHAEEADEDGVTYITDDWKVLASIANDSDGSYSGIWSFHDDMADAYAEDEKGNKIVEVNLSDYVSLSAMTVSAKDDGADETVFELTADDLDELASGGSLERNSGDLSLSLSYQGSMKQGFDLQLSGLKNATELTVSYRTNFNQKSFFDALKQSGIESRNQVFTTVLTNNAHRGGAEDTKYPKQSDEVKHKITASLAIDKSVEVPEATLTNKGYTANYSIDTQIGYSSSKYVETEDYLLRYSDDEEEYTEENKRAMTALANALQLTDLTITARELDGEEETIYSGAEQADGSWSGSLIDSSWKISFDYKPTDTEHVGSLFEVMIEKADGSRISSDQHFTISYKMTLNMDEPEGSSFRESDYYSTGALQIVNGAESSRSVQKTATGRSRVRSFLNILGLGDEESLTVDCGAGVSASYLSDKVVGKAALPASDQNVQKWMVYDWSGTKGQNKISGQLNDALSYTIDSFTYIDPQTGNEVNVDSLDETQKEEILSQVKYILYDNTSFKNVKLYYTKEEPADNLSNLKEDDLLYSYDGPVKGLEEQRTVYDSSVTDREGGEHKLTLKTGLSNQTGGPVGFSASLDNLKCDRFFLAVYETEIDWEKVYKDLEERGYIQPAVQTSYLNTVRNDQGASKDISGSYAELMGESLGKRLLKSDESAGESSWQIKAFTGPNKNDTLIVTDEVTVKAEDKSVQSAAEKAISIDPDSIVIKCGNKTVYENKEAKEGWTAGNIEIKAEGRQLTLTIKNTDESKVVFSNTTYTVEYNTVLDKDIYLANGGKSGDEIALLNAASAKHGNFASSSEAEDGVKPDIPVSADKEYLGNGSDGQDKTTTLWQTVAKTGEAGRKNFTLTDSVSLAEPDEKIEQALQLQDLVIKVQIGTGEEKSYMAENLPDGVSLEINGAGYKLVFAELPKDTTVSLSYAIYFDKNAYEAAGGEGDVKTELKNSFKVSAEDGSVAEKESKGYIEHSKGFSKEGIVSKEKTADGNPLIDWKVKVNLFDLYKAEEISSLKEVSVADELSPVLHLTEGSLKLLTEDEEKIPQDKYRVEENGNVLKVTLTDPKAYPIFYLTFETECGASVSGLVNEASLSVDGKKVIETSSEDIGKLNAANQWGWIKSMKVPSFTPIAYKYLDSELCTEKGLFQFSIVQVDEKGEVIENGYQDTAENDENGKISFKEITYREKPLEGSYYYQIRETTKAEPYTYTIDERVFTIRVDIIKNEVKGKYLVSYQVLDPENYDEVRFDNTTVKTRDFTVTKKWDDKDNKEGARPKSITVYLLNNGERYNNMSVTLNEENGWTYTWEDLPIANGNYSVEEAEVEAYTAKVETEDWSSVITNSYTGVKPKEEDNTPTGDKDKPKDEQSKKEEKLTPTDDSKQPTASAQEKSRRKTPNQTTKAVPTGDFRAESMTIWMLLLMMAILAGADLVKKKKR